MACFLRPVAGATIGPVEARGSNPPFEPKASRAHGETRDMVEHMAAVPAFGRSDSPYASAERFGPVDVFVVATCALFAVPKTLAIWPVLFLATLLPALVQACTLGGLADGAARVEASPLMVLLCVPAGLICVVSSAADIAYMWAVGMLYVVCTNGWERYAENVEVLAIFGGGPSLSVHTPDLVRAMAGQVHRQGALNAALGITNMALVCPWIKHWAIANRYTYRLEARYLVRIGASLGSEAKPKLATALSQVIAAAALAEPACRAPCAALRLHYPLPPKRRHFAMGLQMGESAASIVCATPFSAELRSLAPGLLAAPAYRILFWRSNPFHPLTGYGEVGISSKGELACPLYVLGATRRLSAVALSGFVDRFHGALLPPLGELVRAVSASGEGAALSA
jgi:hypothetical protein